MSHVPGRLVGRRPEVEPSRLVAELVPPPRFAKVRFATYRPDPREPSQAGAVEAVEAFVASAGASASGPQRRGLGLRRRGRRRPSPDGASPTGVYLDGGFGVGKTHLLASAWHAAPGPKAYATFVGMTHLAGALGFGATVEALSGHRLVCIDEFELDDPGDTVLMSTLLGRLVDAGVRLAATSNTLPEALGEGRFAADDFLREIQGLAAHFAVVRVEGEDFRHRGLPKPPPPIHDDAVVGAARHRRGATLDAFPELVEHLAEVHPSRYAALLDGVTAVCLTGVATVHDQAVALRLVSFVDRLYDGDVPVLASGVPLDRLFAPDMLRGGYRKKYFRAVSRLVALGREGAGQTEA